jgi:hypothetical protein
MISGTTPVVVFLAAAFAMAPRDDPLDTYRLMAVLAAVIVIVTASWLHWSIRNIPTAWQPGSCFVGVVVTFCLVGITRGSDEGWRLGLGETTFWAVVAATALAIMLLSWLPARRAAHLVLGNLSAEVADSPLIVKFGARGNDVGTLSVMPDSVRIAVRARSDRFKTEWSYPLADVTAVTVGTARNDSHYPVPGTKTMKPIMVPRGEVVVISLPPGKLVFPVEDAQRVKRFVEERCRAAVAGG